MSEILDACCGGRMWWWDKAHPLAVYVDKREAKKGSVGEVSGRPAAAAAALARLKDSRRG